jgi:hypothetical protein
MLLSDNDLKTLLNFAWLTENPRVASSILAPAIVNQRLTKSVVSVQGRKVDTLFDTMPPKQ